jgi:hypothetical protein
LNTAMPAPLQNIIVAAAAIPGTNTVELRWANGSVTSARFDDVVGRGAFAHLTDPAIFLQVRVAEGGHSLEWPGEIDFSADALWLEAHPEDNPWGERSQAAE